MGSSQSRTDEKPLCKGKKDNKKNFSTGKQETFKSYIDTKKKEGYDNEGYHE